MVICETKDHTILRLGECDYEVSLIDFTGLLTIENNSTHKIDHIRFPMAIISPEGAHYTSVAEVRVEPKSSMTIPDKADFSKTGHVYGKSYLSNYLAVLHKRTADGSLPMSPSAYMKETPYIRIGVNIILKTQTVTIAQSDCMELGPEEELNDCSVIPSKEGYHGDVILRSDTSDEIKDCYVMRLVNMAVSEVNAYRDNINSNCDICIAKLKSAYPGSSRTT